MPAQPLVRLFRLSLAGVLIAGLFSFPVGSVLATPPISGLTLAFANGFDAGAAADSVLALAAGDLDNDGDLDLVSGLGSLAANEVVVWQNDGTPFSGAWSSNAVGATADAVFSVALGDLDNDGWLDIVAVTGTAEDNEIIAWRNDGTPFSGAWTQNDVGASAAAVFLVALGDLDRDGWLDIVTGSAPQAGSEVYAWQNDKSPFSGVWTSNGVGAPDQPVYALALGDLDNDGWLDIVTGLQSTAVNEILAWENDASPFAGTWNSSAVGGTTSSVESLALGDLDKDGDLDIVAGASPTANDAVSIWENDGDPFGNAWTFNTLGATDDHIRAVAAGDLDGDGDLDIASASQSGGSVEVIAWQADSTPFSGAWTRSDVGASADSVLALALGDLDKDGDLDIATGSASAEDNELILWRNTHAHRNAPFHPVGRDVGAAQSAFALALGDLDNDGDLDAVTGHSNLEDFEIIAWQNDGTPFAGGAWSATDVGAAVTSVLSLALGDLDGDGFLDIVSGGVLGVGAEVIAWRNDQTPFNSGWTANGLGELSDSAVSVAVGDLDRDGRLDVVSGSAALAAFELIAWQNDGTPFTGAWTGASAGATAAGINAVALADLDRDGRLDVVSGSAAPAAFELIAWQNDGTPFTGAWTGTDAGAAADSILGLATGDLDRDGYIDVATVTNPIAANEVLVWRNDLTPFTGAWAQTIVGASAAGVTGVALGDLDADGDLDLATSSADAEDFEIIAWHSDGTPFGAASWTQADVGAVDAAANAVNLGDLDRDGDLDIVSGANAPATFEVEAWENLGGAAGLGLTATAAGFIADSAEDDVFKVAFTHNGIAGDHILELATFNLGMFRLDCATAITSGEANALVENLRVRLDDGDGVFETGDDFSVLDVGVLSLAGGVQALVFPDGEAAVQVSAGASNTYWISVLTAAGASSQSPYGLCFKFDPDADALVEAADTPDYSVSLNDTDPGGAGTLALARVQFAPLVLRN